jgi:hypothetical protein
MVAALLVAQPVSSTTGITGFGLLEDAHQIVSGIRDHSWIDSALGGTGVALDTLSLAIDPLGTLAAWGVGWLIEHVRPLQEALDWLSGSADEVAAHADTWANASAFTAEARTDLENRISTDVAGWRGASGEAYRAHAAEHLTVLEGMSSAASGVSAAVAGAGLVVGMTRGIVRDLVAQFVATLAVRLPQWLAVEGLTLGIATPVVAGQISALVARWAAEIQRFVRGLLDSIRRLIARIGSLSELWNRLRMAAERMFRGDDGTGSGRGPGPDDHKPSGAGGSPRAFVDNIVSDPRSLVGKSAEEIAAQFTNAGYSALVRQTFKSGTSGNAIQVRIQGHPEITNIQVHPGGGRHTPEGSPYWKISTSTVGKIWVIPGDFRGVDELGGGAVRYDE